MTFCCFPESQAHPATPSQAAGNGGFDAKETNGSLVCWSVLCLVEQPAAPRQGPTMAPGSCRAEPPTAVPDRL